MKNIISEELKNEISSLKIRAKEIGYKNAFPKFPKEQTSQKAFENVMMGFFNRLDNWKNGLFQLENPGGKYHGKKREDLDKKSEEKIDLRHFTTSSFEELEKMAK